jgi:hypothetical protein
MKLKRLSRSWVIETGQSDTGSSSRAGDLQQNVARTG